MITRQDRSIHKQFLARQKVYEARYAKQFAALLSRQYRRAAEQYLDRGTIYVSSEEYGPLYRKLYKRCIVSEAKVAWGIWVSPLQGDQKDIIDSLVSFFTDGANYGEIIRVWNRMATDYVQVSVLTRLQSVADTTMKAIRNIIEKGVRDGKGAEDIARAIRAESRGEVNKHRSRMIARTETINAMNKGKRFSIVSSNLLYDKKWVAASDDRTRLPHRHMNRENYIPFEQAYFVNGESLDYPGDPQGSAGNVINCRCTEVYQVRRGADGRPLRNNP